MATSLEQEIAETRQYIAKAQAELDKGVLDDEERKLVRLELIELRRKDVLLLERQSAAGAAAAAGGGGAAAAAGAAAGAAAAGAAVGAAAVAQSGSLEEGELFAFVQLEYEDKMLEAELLVDTGCDLDLNISEYKAAQLGLPYTKRSARLEMGQGNTGGIKCRGPVLTTLLLEGETATAYVKDPKRLSYLTVWTDDDTAGRSSSGCSASGSGSGSSRSTSSSSGGSSTGGVAQELSPSAGSTKQSPSLAGEDSSNTDAKTLKIHILSPIKRGKDTHDFDAILGAPGMARLHVGIDSGTMRLYRKKVSPAFRKKVASTCDAG